MISRRSVMRAAAVSALGAGVPSSLKRAHANEGPTNCSSSVFGEWETIGYRPPAVKRRVILWLSRLQDALSSGRMGPEQVLPMTRITGAVFGDAGELVLLGVEEEDGGATVAIVPDDIVLALRCSILSDEPPGVSIDPKVVNGEMQPYQDVVYFGGVEDTRAGQLAFSCDYWMKQVAAGLIALPVRNFCSYADRFRSSLSRAPQANGIGSRFWYYPRETMYLVSPDLSAMELTDTGIDLLSQGTFLDRDRENKSEHSQVDDYANAFAKEMTERYDDLSIVNNDLARLRNFATLLDAFKWLAEQQFPLPRWQHLLYDYSPIPAHTTRKAKTVRVGFATGATSGLVLEGGVQLEVRLSKQPRVDTTGYLEKDIRLIQTAAAQTSEPFYTFRE